MLYVQNKIEEEKVKTVINPITRMTRRLYYPNNQGNNQQWHKCLFFVTILLFHTNCNRNHFYLQSTSRKIGLFVDAASTSGPYRHRSKQDQLQSQLLQSPVAPDRARQQRRQQQKQPQRQRRLRQRRRQLVDDTTLFVGQDLGIPYEGQHSGVAVADLNQDGLLDLLFSAGRHRIDQPYALINLGRKQRYHSNIDAETDHGMDILFSDPLPFGEPGGYYQVDAFDSNISSTLIQQGHTGVLLAGGICTQSLYCDFLSVTPAVLLDVVVAGCTIDTPNVPCEIKWYPIWQDPNPLGDRNGAIATTITNGITTDPAIVLASPACTAIFLTDPITGEYGEASLVITPEDKDDADDGNVHRAAGLAVGFIGTRPGIVVGARTTGTLSPAPPLVAIIQHPDSSFEWFTIDDGVIYKPAPSRALQPVGVVLDDWNGDGLVDIAIANYISSSVVDPQVPIPHYYYQVREEIILNPKNSNYTVPIQAVKRNDDGVEETTDVMLTSTTRQNAMTTFFGGRSVDSGPLFTNEQEEGDAKLPDLVYGTADGNIHFLANLGIDKEMYGKFLGFEERYVFDLPGQCQVRDLLVTTLQSCTISIVCAVLCGSSGESGNYIFHSTQNHCPNATTTITTLAPTNSSYPSTSTSPSSSSYPSIAPT